MFADLATLGYRWVTVKAAHALTPENLGAAEQLLDAASDAGLRRSIWTWCEGDPEPEAKFHASLCRSLDVDALIPNCEFAYEFSGAWKSQVYAATIRDELPETVIGVSVLGGASIPAGETLSPYARWFDVKPWLDIDADFLPQAYWNMAPEYRPSNTVHTWQLTGVPIERIHPTFGLWEVPAPKSAEDYRRDTPEGVVGFSSYLLEQYPLIGEYRTLAGVPHA